MKKLFFVLALLSLFIWPASALAGGPSHPTPFEATYTPCQVVDPGVEHIDSSGVLHLRNRVLAGLVQSDNPLMNGDGQITINADVNLNTGMGRVLSTLQVSNPLGAWQLMGRGVISPDGSLVGMQGFGTEGLAGMRIALAATPAEMTLVPCEPVSDPQHFEGVIAKSQPTFNQ